MVINIFEMIWLFTVYSFAGWIFETVIGVCKQKRFVNKGLINGPFCILYGFTAVVMTIGLSELDGLWLFLFAMIYATVAEFVAGRMIERLYHERWWDYSGLKWNFDGLVCLPISVFWGVLGFLSVKWVNSFLLAVFHILPSSIGNILALAIIIVLTVDALGSFILLKGKGKNFERWEKTNSKFVQMSARLNAAIIKHVDSRIHKAYPENKVIEVAEKEKNVFASGCDFYKIVLLFILGAFLGDIIETIFCRITAGVWMSRSSLVWGPFSIVWGLAIAAATALLYRYKDRSDSFIFLVGTFLGGAYEYLCSVFTEIVFGKVFWDYSKIPFNLGGRINLLYCFFWGIAAFVWIKKLYPVLSLCIEKIPMKFGKAVTWVLIIFMSCDIIVSCMALIRYDERSKNIGAESAIQEWLDVHYNDEKMKMIYPNAIEVTVEQSR